MTCGRRASLGKAAGSQSCPEGRQAGVSVLDPNGNAAVTENGFRKDALMGASC
jgi:hypothetical protein